MVLTKLFFLELDIFGQLFVVRLGQNFNPKRLKLKYLKGENVNIIALSNWNAINISDNYI